jgi:hypothetical protein
LGKIPGDRVFSPAIKRRSTTGSLWFTEMATRGALFDLSSSFFREATNRISSGFLYEAIKAAVAVYCFNSDKKNLTVSIATGLILALLILVVSYLDL